MSPRRHTYELQGPVRTCYWYECKKSKTAPVNVTPSDICKRDEVLRCIKYEDESAIAPYVGQRKKWSQYIHAGETKREVKTKRAWYPPYSREDQLFLERIADPTGVGRGRTSEAAAHRPSRRIRKRR